MAMRIDYPTIVSDPYKSLLSVERYARSCGIEKSLLHLIKLRASYLSYPIPAGEGA